MTNKISSRGVVVKNIILVVLLTISYPEIQREFAGITNENILNSALGGIGLVLVAALFANFQFSYQYVVKQWGGLMNAHIITFLAMWVSGILLLMVDRLILNLVGNLPLFRITVLLFIVCMILWDFWDYRRLQVSEN